MRGNGEGNRWRRGTDEERGGNAGGEKEEMDKEMRRRWRRR